ncbi:phosphoribosylglycinamide formyltransferase [Candidatus Bathyarchaeota archaeon]|nr:phosphoribosylglycinamide formyltransferase [Candidatus Bathyarchaeota archaeon]MBS7612721.1 phosphoribosylglycinamide formyltransferase [Candidatus Bathyarchaeota archaeon]MBS7617765.1 phosphoribosylglycinamide formyltransferase [Candidatus Bathyarchaeota archaeon]
MRLVVLGSTKGTDLQAIIDAIKSGVLNAEVVCVISDRKNAYILDRARQHGIEALFINPKGLTREEYDKLIMEEVEKRSPVDLILLIGYMRILSSQFVRRYRWRIVNIHPSLLPAFAGGMDLDVHKAVLDYGVKITGCTLHFVDEGVDTGPIILQKPVVVDGEETPETLKAKVQKAEQEIILEAIKLFQRGLIKVEGRRVRIARDMTSFE